jgi:hypothetical protein
MNKPSALMSRTRETSSRPLQRQQTQRSSEAGRRESARREYEGFCCKRHSPSGGTLLGAEGLGWGPNCGAVRSCFFTATNVAAYLISSRLEHIQVQEGGA